MQAETDRTVCGVHRFMSSGRNVILTFSGLLLVTLLAAYARRVRRS